MMKARTYMGQRPDIGYHFTLDGFNGTSESGIVSLGQWRLTATAHFHFQNYSAVSIKVWYDGEVDGKANFWLTFIPPLGRIRKGGDSKRLQDEYPEIYSAVDGLVREFCAKGKHLRDPVEQRVGGSGRFLAPHPLADMMS